MGQGTSDMPAVEAARWPVPPALVRAAVEGNAPSFDLADATTGVAPTGLQQAIAATVRGVDANAAEPLAPPAEDARLADVAAEVMAAHDARIAVLRHHIDALHDVKGGAPLLADLQARLDRAEAARRLAAARITGAPADLAAADPAPVRLSPVTTLHLRVTASSPHGTIAGPAWTAVAGLWPRGRAALHRLGPAAAHRLAMARRSLAVARRLLAASTHRAVRTPASGEVVVAGLWQWAGSTTWSLPPGPDRRA